MADGVLQWQRRAYEYHGQGNWIDKEKEVPVTRGGEDLVDLVDEDPPVRAEWRERKEGDGKPSERIGMVVEERKEPSESLIEVKRTRTEVPLVEEVNDVRDASWEYHVGEAQEHGRALQDGAQNLPG